MKSAQRLLLACAIAVPATVASAAPLFTDNFDDGAGASRWNVVATSADTGSNFVFDYSNVLGYDGNPIGKPNATQTTSTGLQLYANRAGTAAGGSTLASSVEGINVYAKDISNSAPLVMTFDAYFRFLTPTGSTQYVLFGAQHSTQTGTWTSIGPAATSGVWFTANSDGTTTATDYRTTVVNTQDATGANYLGGSRDNNNAGWTSLFPDLDGAGTLNIAGAFGNRWVNVRVTYDPTTGAILWEMKNAGDANYVTAYSATNANLQSTGTITLGLADPFSSASPEDAYVIFDNVVVTVPEPTTAALALPALALLSRRRRA